MFISRLAEWHLDIRLPSPSPDPDTVPNDDDEAFNWGPTPFEQEAPEEDITHEQGTQHQGDEDEGGIESGSDGSDFSETERTNEAKRQYKKGNNRPHSPTVEERDEEDRIDEEEYLQDIEHRSPPQSKGRNGQRLTEQEEEEEENQQADDEDEDFQHRSGPISQSVKDAAYNLHRNYISAMEELARSCGKPSKALFRLVGDENVTPRPLLPWNAFQSWYSSCGEKKKPKDSKYLFQFISYSS
jgi:hypothetical protein